MIRNFVAVGLGGMIGSMLRYAMVIAFKTQPQFPYATICVNIIGSFIIGAIAGVAFKNATFDHEWRLFLATGICGGFTTFSSFSWECYQLIQQNRFGAAGFYIGASILFGIASAFSGWVLTK